MTTDITQILARIQQGDPLAVDELLPLVYDELRQLAARKMARESPGQTIQATALVHESFFDWCTQARLATGTAGLISSLPPPGPCDRFWWSEPARRKRSSTVATDAESL